MSALILILLVIVVLAGFVFLYIFKTQRQLVNLDELCKNAMSQIAVQLNSRWDALLALAKTASQYAKHESETLINVINARRQSQVTTAEEASQQQGELSQVLGKLIAIGEAYPDLKASDLYGKTMDSVNSYEENVRLSRMVYNDTATKMNRMVRQWPSSFVASMLNFREKAYLTVDEEKKNSYPDLDEAFKK
ncbi:MAG: LemA family protein [Prevotella sp.]|jgi:LemA protein|nr:LemA family protein [Prevotella sp.]